MKISILFVEDEPSIRNELSLFLKRYAKDDLHIAENGKEGLALFRTLQPDIVISDIRMPIMNGIDMVKEIKKINAKQAIIFTTAHSDSSFFLDAIDMQVEGYLLKPIDLKLLDEKIKNISENIFIKKQYYEQTVVMDEIAYLQGNMLAVLNKDMKPIFLNKKWMELLGVNTLKELDEDKCISRYFQKKEGYFYPSGENICRWVDELYKMESDSRIVAMKFHEDEEVRAYIVSFTCIKKTNHLIVTFAEITHIEKEKATYRKQAYTDTLTKLYNRAKFNQELEHAIIGAKSSHGKLSIILFDLDYFKQINDTYGHLVGDQILIELSKHIKMLIRSNDLLARWGGEEFVVLLPNTDTKGAAILAENMRTAIETYIFSHDIRLTCSFGVVGMENADKTAVDLLKKADEVLYMAKHQGRNRVVIAQ